MTDGYDHPTTDDPEPGGTGQPGAFEVPPSGGASWRPADPTWPGSPVHGVPSPAGQAPDPAQGTPAGSPATEPAAEPGRPDPSQDPTWPGLGAAGTAPGAGGGWHTGEPTWPRTAAGWPHPPADPTWPGAGWPGHGAHSTQGAQGAGWNPGPGGGWAPPGAGWVPPAGGWPPPGGGWAPPPPERRPPRRSHLVALAVVVAVVVLLLGTGIGYAVRGGGSSTNAASETPTRHSPVSPFGGTSGGTSGTTSGSTSSSGDSRSSAASGSPSDVSSLATRVDPELVDINTKLKDEDEEAAGTGMVLTSTGEVLTNNHVIDGATTITATDIGNDKTYQATVVGYDRTDDVAVIQLKNASGLKTVSIGNSSNAAVGEGVVGIGNAGGVGGTPSTAGGSITALNQSITASDEGSGTSENLTGLIETNCGIEPGDSGGPLVNTSGQVIGMDTAASESSGEEPGEFAYTTTTSSSSSSADQGYSIPINEAITLEKKIKAGSGSSTIHIGTTAFLGVEVESTSATTTIGQTGRTAFGGFGTQGGSTFTTTTRGGSSTTTKGAHIKTVIAGDPAAAAGLAGGDVITTFGGKAVTSATSLTSIINGYHPGDKVKVTWVTSSGQQQSATVTLANGPAA